MLSNIVVPKRDNLSIAVVNCVSTACPWNKGGKHYELTLMNSELSLFWITMAWNFTLYTIMRKKLIIKKTKFAKWNCLVWNILVPTEALTLLVILLKHNYGLLYKSFWLILILFFFNKVWTIIHCTTFLL